MLAIVIPFYKLTFFEETLKSLRNQTIRNFNVYIGNDASSDDPRNLINKYTDSINLRKYVRFSDNIGGENLVGQWKRCTDLIEDESWIMILGDDDYLDENLVERFYWSMDTFLDKFSLIRFASRIIYSNGEAPSEVFEHPEFEKATDAAYRRMTGKTRSSLSEYIFKRETYDALGFPDFPLGWHSDDYGWLDLSEKKPIFTINSAVVHIRISEENISNSEKYKKEKIVAKEMFYWKIIRNKLGEFNKTQRVDILGRYEGTVGTRNITGGKRLILTYYYLINFNLIKFLKYFKRFLKTKFN